VRIDPPGRPNQRRCFVLLGPPASGKGTQAARLAAYLGAVSISTGALLRQGIAASTALGAEAAPYLNAGELVPDRVMITLVRERIARLEPDLPAVLDGFPRTLPQAQVLEQFLPPERVILLELDDEEVILRIGGRRLGPTGETYHVVFNPPPPDIPVTQRSDDGAAVVRERLAIHYSETIPLLDFYRARGRLVAVDGRGSIDEVFARVVAATGADRTHAEERH
jgi:adenylate kinase